MKRKSLGTTKKKQNTNFLVPFLINLCLTCCNDSNHHKIVKTVVFVSSTHEEVSLTERFCYRCRIL